MTRSPIAIASLAVISALTFGVSPAAAAEPVPYLVRDINTAGSSGPYALAEMNGILYFAAKDSARGRELWRSDGTEAGTRRVKDIRVGLKGSNPDHMTAINGMLYFNAEDGVHGDELWVSDGTKAGTRMLRDLNPGSADSTPFFFTESGGLVYFSAEDATRGRELWRTDGTDAGTFRITDLAPGPDWSFVYPLGDLNGKLFFVAEPWDTQDSDSILYRTDGTTLGTKPFRNAKGKLIRGVSHMTKLGSTTLFATQTALWRSLGTSATTTKIAELSAYEFAEFNGAMYFAAANALWRTDATAGGTVKVRDFVNEWGDPYGISGNIVVLGDEMFFFAKGEAWLSDGTADGSHSLGVDVLNDDQHIVVLDGVAYFDGHPGDTFEDCYDTAGPITPSFTPAPSTLVYKSDGTTAGTSNLSCDWAYNYEVTVAGTHVFFVSNAGTSGAELWAYKP